jgi:hypothetical protein
MTMKNLFALVGLLVVGFAGAGWYLGWYKFSEQTDSQGHIQLKVNVDPNKIKADGKKLETAIENVGSKATQGGLVPVPPPVQTNPYGGQVPMPSPPPGGQWQVTPPPGSGFPQIQVTPPPPPPGLPGSGGTD